MIHKIFSVYDAKAASYSGIQLYVRREEAARAFSIACNTESSDFHKYAEDYSLFEIGELDSETGIISSYMTPLHVISAHIASKTHQDYYAYIASKQVA